VERSNRVTVTQRLLDLPPRSRGLIIRGIEDWSVSLAGVWRMAWRRLRGSRSTLGSDLRSGARWWSRTGGCSCRCRRDTRDQRRKRARVATRRTVLRIDFGHGQRRRGGRLRRLVFGGGGRLAGVEGIGSRRGRQVGLDDQAQVGVPSMRKLVGRGKAVEVGVGGDGGFKTEFRTGRRGHWPLNGSFQRDRDGGATTEKRVSGARRGEWTGWLWRSRSKVRSEEESGEKRVAETAV
jgi:hypothetical protein